MTKLEERSITELIIIIYSVSTNNYSVVSIADISNWSTIWSGKDLETAKAVREAYCFGYIDRKMEEEIPND